MSTILIIEDEIANRQALAAMLRLEGYRVLEASGGRQALALLEKELPDLILLDLMMPEMNGYDVFQQLQSQERTRHIPVLVVSALASTWDIERAAQAGLHNFLTKPFEPEELFARIREALAAAP